ncbi:BnaC01g32060D [Brassica napus]|uniref:(rape) hypothetical protein n=1 Tax=Brassica napus TaxID=3708 RepID=A0A078G1C8_BRANA|nr:unnamed protein product [Brassica napus]CDY19274.1 BnaC01g32060D [Brassica napus]
MSSILVALCSFSCVFSCFTDCFKGTDGSRKYGTVTKKGLWTYADPGSVDLSKYKLRIADFVHAVFVVSVFGTLVLLDRKNGDTDIAGFSAMLGFFGGTTEREISSRKASQPSSSSSSTNTSPPATSYSSATDAALRRQGRALGDEIIAGKHELVDAEDSLLLERRGRTTTTERDADR